MPKPTHKVAMLTAGGLAPCLSAAVGGLIERYGQLSPEAEIVGYRGGYRGLLTGELTAVSDMGRAEARRLRHHGGSPLKNSRVNLANAEDCVKRGLIRPGEDPLLVAREQLKRDGITILHTIGGDDTNTTASALASELARGDYRLTVVGLPKTVDNDIVPIRQSLGALTAAEQASRFAQHVLAEHGSNPRMLIVHEVMGRASGWLTAAAARDYMAWHAEQQWLPGIGLDPRRWAIHALYVPELAIDLAAEAKRLRAVMDEVCCVNIFLAEGAGIDDIVADLEAAGETVGRDPFGHVKIDTINPGRYFADRFSQEIGAEKKMVQKSGYYSRSAAANDTDLTLIREMAELAVRCALEGRPGVVGHDEERGDELRAIEFERIAGHKPFDASQAWFTDLLAATGQA